MIREYIDHLENRDIYPDTDRVYAISDVPPAWKDKVFQTIKKEGCYIADDGTVYHVEVYK